MSVQIDFNGTIVEFDTTPDDAVVRKVAAQLGVLKPTDVPFQWTPANILDMAKAGMFLGEQDTQEKIFKRIQERNLQGVTETPKEEISGAISGAADIVATPFAVIPSAIGGAASALGQADLSKGLKTGKEIFGALTPSTYIGGADKTTYQSMMAPFFPIMEAPHVAAKGYGEIAGSLGASEKTKKQVEAGVELGFMGGFAGLGVQAGHALYKYRQSNQIAAEKIAYEEMLKQEQRKQQERETYRPSAPGEGYVQRELPLEYPNKFGLNTSKLEVDEQGIPINKSLTEDVVRQQQEDIGQLPLFPEEAAKPGMQPREMTPEEQAIVSREQQFWNTDARQEIVDKATQMREERARKPQESEMAWEQQRQDKVFEQQLQLEQTKELTRQALDEFEKKTNTKIEGENERIWLETKLADINKTPQLFAEQFKSNPAMLQRMQKARWKGIYDSLKGEYEGKFNIKFPLNFRQFTKVAEKLELPKKLSISDTRAKHLGGVGKRGFKQGGAIGFEPSKEPKVKPSKTFEEYLNNLKRDYGQVNEAVAKQAWDSLQKNKQEVQKRKLLPSTKSEDVSAIYGRSLTNDEAIQAAVTSPDLLKVEELNVITNEGRQAAWRTNNPGFVKLIDRTNVIKEEAQKYINKLTNNEKEGFLTHFRKLNFTSSKEAISFLQKMIEAKGNAQYDWGILSPAQQKVADSYQRWGDGILKLVNETQAESGRKPIKKLPNWFASMWFGDFIAPLYVRGMSTEGKPTRQLVTFIKETSMPEAKKAVEYYRQYFAEQGLDVEINDPKHTSSLTEHKAKQYIGLGNMFEDFVALLSNDNTKIQAVLNALDKQNDKAAHSTAAVKQHFKYWSGVEGFMGNKPWKSPEQNVIDMIKGMDIISASVAEWAGNKKINEFMSSVKDNPDIGLNTKSSLQLFVDHVLGTDEQMVKSNIIVNRIISGMAEIPGIRNVGDRSRIKHTIRAVSNIETGRILMGSARNFMQQMVQSAQVNTPKLMELAAKTGDYDVISPQVQAYTLGNILFLAKDRNFNKYLPKEYIDLMKEMEQAEVYDPTLIEMNLFQGKLTTKTYNTAALTLRIPEQVSRTVSFLTDYFYLKKNGYSHEDAFGISENLTRELMGNYNEYVKARVFSHTGLLGDMAGRLQSYKVFQLTQLKHYLSLAKNEGNITPLATMLSINVALGGAIGVIGVDLAEQVITLLRETALPDLPSLKELMVEHMPEAVAFGGLSTLTDQGLYGSFGQSTVGQGSLTDLFPIYGATLESAKSLGQMGQFVIDPSKWSGLSNLEKAEILKGLKPTMMNEAFDKGLLRQETTGNLLSPTTNTPVYVPKDKSETELGAMDFLWNIPSFEKAKGKTINRLAIETEKRNKTRMQAVSDDFQKVMTDITSNNITPAKEARAMSLVRKYIERGGDPRSLYTQLSTKHKQRIVGTRVENMLLSANPQTRKQANKWIKEMP